MNTRVLASVVLASGIAGCVGTGDAPARITTLDSAGYAMCPWGGAQPDVVDVHDKAGFEAFLARAELEAPRVAGWRPEFPGDRVVLVAVGPRPSAGYRAEWLDATQSGDRLRARVEVRPPASGEMSATVIVHPCVVAWLRAPGVKTVEVIDAGSGEPLSAGSASTRR